jgi:hypothetical protein
VDWAARKALMLATPALCRGCGCCCRALDFENLSLVTIYVGKTPTADPCLIARLRSLERPGVHQLA